MTRIMIVDDEKPIAESISLIVKRNLGEEFAVCAIASSGREAMEKASASAPEIILMDVHMPGISGLDVIREIRKAGSPAAFILVTAYERFDIAKEAVAMGIVDYLLKPVSKDKLAAALRSARDYLGKRGEFERKELAYREREEWMRSFAETAFFHGMILGERPAPADEARYLEIFGFSTPLALAGALCYRSLSGTDDADSRSSRLHEGIRASLRYKSEAVAGPLVGNVAALIVPLGSEKDAAGASERLRAILGDAHREDYARGGVRLGFAAPGRLAEAGARWPEALAAALDGRNPAEEPAEDDFRDDRDFLPAIMAGNTEAAMLSLEKVLGRGSVKVDALRYRIITLFGSAYTAACGRELISPRSAGAFLDFADLQEAKSAGALQAAARLRFAVLASVTAGARTRSPLVVKAIDHLAANFGKQINLETSADELGVTPSRLSKAFIEETGKGFSDYLIGLRIDRAKALLARKDASIKEVSLECGYGDPNYFSRLFKKVTGATPTAFMTGLAGGTENVDPE